MGHRSQSNHWSQDGSSDSTQAPKDSNREAPYQMAAENTRILISRGMNTKRRSPGCMISLMPRSK